MLFALLSALPERFTPHLRGVGGLLLRWMVSGHHLSPAGDAGRRKGLHQRVPVLLPERSASKPAPSAALLPGWGEDSLLTAAILPVNAAYPQSTPINLSPNACMCREHEKPAGGRSFDQTRLRLRQASAAMAAVRLARLHSALAGTGAGGGGSGLGGTGVAPAVM